MAGMLLFPAYLLIPISKPWLTGSARIGILLPRLGDWDRHSERDKPRFPSLRGHSPHPATELFGSFRPDASSHTQRDPISAKPAWRTTCITTDFSEQIFITFKFNLLDVIQVAQSQTISRNTGLKVSDYRPEGTAIFHLSLMLMMHWYYSMPYKGVLS